jgi:hypothetical protein
MEVLYMSRSYKKFPIVIYEKEDYRYLNRRLRHDKLAEIPNGGAYRRHSSGGGTWTGYWSKEQAIQDWKGKPWIRERYSYDEWMAYWKSSMRK